MSHHANPKIHDIIARAIKLQIFKKKETELIAKLGEHLNIHSTGREKALLKMTDSDFKIFIEQAKGEIR